MSRQTSRQDFSVLAELPALTELEVFAELSVLAELLVLAELEEGLALELELVAVDEPSVLLPASS
jgi:hypothetical protein